LVQVAAKAELAWTAGGAVARTPHAARAAAPAIMILLTVMLASVDPRRPAAPNQALIHSG
jgi:hypothetical protein